MAKFQNRGVRQQVYLPSIHAKITGRRVDGSEIRTWDQDAPSGKTIIEPGQILEVEYPADIDLLRVLTRERYVTIRGEKQKRPGFFVELEA